MAKLRIVKTEHGVVMSHTPSDRIAAGVESARKLGMRWQHYGWPGITRTLDGDILVGASERVSHVCPFGREVISRSTDRGRTWTEPQVTFDSLADDRDHSLATLPDGTIVSTWFSSGVFQTARSRLPEWDDIAERIGAHTLQALSRGWLRRSHDGGHTWEEQVYPTLVGQHAGPSALSDGRLIYCGPADVLNEPRLVATHSGDGGKTWGIIGEIPCDAAVHPHTGPAWPALNESHALEVGPGRVLCVFRANRGPYNVTFARSEDGGRTWTEPEDSGVYGFPSYLVRLRAGPVLCVFGDRAGDDTTRPQAIRAMLSYDDGGTWDTENVLTIREFPYRADMGYPVALEVDTNELLCAYYSIPGPRHTGEAFGSLEGAVGGILSTRFWLDEG